MTTPRPKSKVESHPGAGEVGEVPSPAWWLPGPHLPTIYGKLFRKIDLPATQRVRWQTPDGDLLSVERLEGEDDAPRLVLFHGLEGGTHSTYARALLQRAKSRGWWMDLVLWRTCDGELVNRVPRSYHSGASDDADFAISRIVEDDPGRPLLLMGVSLGGNVLLKWLGERGSNVPPNVRAAAAVSVPYDLAAAAKRIEEGFSSVYGKFFLKTLKQKALAKAVSDYFENFSGAAGSDTINAVLWNDETDSYEPDEKGSDKGLHVTTLDFNVQYTLA